MKNESTNKFIDLSAKIVNLYMTNLFSTQSWLILNQNKSKPFFKNLSPSLMNIYGPILTVSSYVLSPVIATNEPKTTPTKPHKNAQCSSLKI